MNVNWSYISKNPAAIDIIKEDIINGGKNIDWYLLSQNPAIFIINKEKYQMNVNIVISKLI